MDPAAHLRHRLAVLPGDGFDRRLAGDDGLRICGGDLREKRIGVRVPAAPTGFSSWPSKHWEQLRDGLAELRKVLFDELTPAMWLRAGEHLLG